MKPNSVTFPNMLSVSRFFIAGVLLYFIVNHEIIYSLSAYALAFITDSLDGFLARRSGKLTKLGYYLDAYADNTLIALIFVGMFFAGTIGTMEIIAYIIIVSLTTTGFFLAPSRDDFYAAFDRSYMKKIGGVAIALYVTSGMLELSITSPILSICVFAILLTTASFFLFFILETKKQTSSKYVEG